MKLPATLLITMSLLSCNKNVETTTPTSDNGNVEHNENDNSSIDNKHSDTTEVIEYTDNCPACGMG